MVLFYRYTRPIKRKKDGISKQLNLRLNNLITICVKLNTQYFFKKSQHFVFVKSHARHYSGFKSYMLIHVDKLPKQKQKFQMFI